VSEKDDVIDSNIVRRYGPRVSDEFITSDDDVGPIPDGPLHQNSSWPTPSNISLEMATDLCDGAIKGSPLYDDCLNYTVVDRMAFVNSCVADILVTNIIIGL